MGYGSPKIYVFALNVKLTKPSRFLTLDFEVSSLYRNASKIKTVLWVALGVNGLGLFSTHFNTSWLKRSGVLLFWCTLFFFNLLLFFTYF